MSPIVPVVADRFKGALSFQKNLIRFPGCSPKIYRFRSL